MEKERAVTYSRVSSDEEVQLNALVNQVKEAKMAVENKGWLLVDEYIDEGKSGTTTKRRDEYNRLVTDLESNKFDIIVVKSQDRLMRNTREWYVFVDKLVQNGKKLFFYLENKFYSADDALITGIKAILAEEYSRDLSKKINNAHTHRQQSGSNVVITSKTWGYDNINKTVVINETEAEIVRMIYTLSAQGVGCRTISKELELKGIKGRTGKKFQEATIRRIIRNPLYKGDAIMNKYHVNFDTKKTVTNSKSEWIIHKDIVPPIVDEALWQKANDSMDERSKIIKASEFGEKIIGVNKQKYKLSGKLVCGECGQLYWRKYRKNSKGNQIVDWCCSEYIARGRKTNNTNKGKKKEKIRTGGGCDNIHLKEDIFMGALYDVAKIVFCEKKDKLIEQAMAILERVLSEGNSEKIKQLRDKNEETMKKREALLDKMLDGIIPDDLFKRKDSALEQEYKEIENKIAELEKAEMSKAKLAKRLANLREHVTDIANKDLALQDLFEHLDKIIVYRDHAQVLFDLFEPIDIQIERKGYKTVIMSVSEHR